MKVSVCHCPNGASPAEMFVAPRTSAHPDQVGRHRCLIHENETRCLKPLERLALVDPDPPAFGNVGEFAFRSHQGFFW
jgi:hypothetical protein